MTDSRPASVDDAAVAPALRFPGWLTWSPLVLSVAVTALYALVHRTFKLETVDVSQFAADRLCRGIVWEAKAEAAKTYWAASIFVATVVMVALAIVSACSIASAKRSWWVGGLVALAVLVIGGTILVLPGWVVPALVRQEMQIVQRVSGFDPAPLLVAFLSALFSVAFLVAIGLRFELGKLARGDLSITTLVGTQLVVRNALALTTSWLIVGVIGIGLFQRMASANVIREAVPAMDALGAASTILAGAFYSALLASTFAPAEYLLRRAARSLVPTTGEGSNEGAEKWLSDQGFEVSVSRSLLRALAVFGPLLAGVLQNLAEFK